jgi:hypothetical protein
MTEPISIMLPYDNRPKTVTVSVELSDAYVALLRAAETVSDCFGVPAGTDNQFSVLQSAIEQVIRAGGGKPPTPQQS